MPVNHGARPTGVLRHSPYTAAVAERLTSVASFAGQNNQIDDTKVFDIFECMPQLAVLQLQVRRRSIQLM